MRTRISDLIRDAIAIIENCDDPDCAAWLGQARCELAVLEAKAELRRALGEIEGPVSKPKPAKPTAPTFKPTPKPAPKGKPGNGKASTTVRL